MTHQSFSENPIAGIGLVLSNIAAGMRGQPFPSMQIRRDHLAQKEIELRQFDVTLGIVGEGVKLFGGADLDDPKIGKSFDDFVGKMGQSIPELEGIMRSALDIRKTTGTAAIENAGDYSKFMLDRCGAADAQCVKKAFLNPAIMKQADEEIDRENIPLIIETFNAIGAALKASPEGQQAFKKIEENGITIDEIPALNAVLPEGFKLSESMINTLIRSPEAQNAVMGLGFKPSSVALKEAEAAATETTPVVKLQRQLEDAISRGDPKAAKEIQDIITKKGTIVGRTPQDVPSINRQDEIRGNLQTVSRARGRLANVRQSIVEDRSRGGLTGTAKRLIQEGIGIATDFADIGIDVSGFINDLLPDIKDDINSGRTDPVLAPFFDSTIPRNDAFVNGIAYALARSRKGSGRLNRDDFLSARADVKITGLTSTDAVLARLQAIDEELSSAQDDFQSRLEGEGRGEIPTFEIKDGKLVKVQ